jgi:hypothetical protein
MFLDASLEEGLAQNGLLIRWIGVDRKHQDMMKSDECMTANWQGMNPSWELLSSPLHPFTDSSKSSYFWGLPWNKDAPPIYARHIFGIIFIAGCRKTANIFDELSLHKLD